MTAAKVPIRNNSGIPGIFGILNLTADSFSDGGAYSDAAAALEHAAAMLDEGAAAIDIGAESTRPGASARDAADETAALLPVIRGLRAMRPDCVISVDTRKASVAEAALDAGADIINDVSGFQFDPDMPRAVAAAGAGVIIMHMRGTPETMQNPENLIYSDLTGEINAFFADRLALAEKAGIAGDKIMLDPGIGFSKTPEQNWELIRGIDAFRMHGLPLFYGISRKSFLKPLCGNSAPDRRDAASAGVLAFLAGKRADFVRVHSVGPAREAMRAYLHCADGPSKQQERD